MTAPKPLAARRARVLAKLDAAIDLLDDLSTDSCDSRFPRMLRALKALRVRAADSPRLAVAIDWIARACDEVAADLAADDKAAQEAIDAACGGSVMAITESGPRDLLGGAREWSAGWIDCRELHGITVSGFRGRVEFRAGACWNTGVVVSVFDLEGQTMTIMLDHRTGGQGVSYLVTRSAPRPVKVPS